MVAIPAISGKSLGLVDPIGSGGSISTCTVEPARGAVFLGEGGSFCVNCDGCSQVEVSYHGGMAQIQDESILVLKPRVLGSSYFKTHPSCHCKIL